jgi:hypothetical protein
MLFVSVCVPVLVLVAGAAGAGRVFVWLGWRSFSAPARARRAHHSRARQPSRRRVSDYNNGRRRRPWRRLATIINGEQWPARLINRAHRAHTRTRRHDALALPPWARTGRSAHSADERESDNLCPFATRILVPGPTPFAIKSRPSVSHADRLAGLAGDPISSGGRRARATRRAPLAGVAGPARAVFDLI